MSAVELQLDGLPGPTHHYGGLSPGNLASSASSGSRSHPRAAALQGLAKMARLHALGVPQAVLPPQPRPDLVWLRRLGFGGDDARVVERAGAEAPELLAAAYSASSMWAANAATVMPSPDTGDGRVHVVPANLSSERHRALEAPFTARLLRAVLPDPERCVHHPPIPLPGDEGAANHTRLCRDHGSPGIELFVYGRPDASPRLATSPPSRGAEDAPAPPQYPARQSEAASRAVARLGGLDAGRTLFVRQHPAAIDAGVFHNDVIATGDRSLLLLHERAWVDQPRMLETIRETFARTCGGELRVVEISSEALSLSRAVASYLFNCQIVARPGGGTAWIGPAECREDDRARAVVEALAGPEGPFDELHYVDLRESMRNGGGPACLRLRVVLRDEELATVPSGVRVDERLVTRLEDVIRTHYRESLDPADLADPALVDESRAALDAITGALGLPAVYDFQRD